MILPKVLPYYLEENAEKFPARTALTFVNYDKNYREEINWQEFNDRANRYSHYLYSKGIKKGDKVGVLMHNCVEWLPLYFGILKIGALASPMNFRFTKEEVEYCSKLADQSLLIYGPEFVERVQNTECEHVFIKDIDISNFDNSNPNVELTEDDLCAIYFSSGTTGMPKAVLHRHRALCTAARNEQINHKITHDDNFLCIPPFYHTGSKMHWVGSLVTASKGTFLLGIKPEHILRALSEEKCTVAFLVVPWAQDIIAAIENKNINLSEYDLSNWRLLYMGAQPIPKKLIESIKTTFPSILYDTTFGMTETCGGTSLSLGMENTHKYGSVGKACTGYEVKIVDDNHNEVGAEEVGELAIRGPAVMVEYYKNPEETAKTIDSEGWLYSGDMAKKDKDGFVYIVDRKKDVIISGGENIYPVQIENFMRKNIPQILDVACIGIPDERLVEVVMAVISVKEGQTLSEDEVFKTCEQLPRYIRPRKVVFDNVPRSPTGKIEKVKIRAKYNSQDIWK